jgi:hypothetical protein
MKAILIALLIGLITACASPSGPSQVPETESEAASTSIERIDPVEPAPVVELTPEPETEAAEPIGT